MQGPAPAIRGGYRCGPGRDLDRGRVRNHPGSDAAIPALDLNNVDSAHHRYGQVLGYSAIAANDANVGRVLRALDEAGVRSRTAVFIVADHGFIATPKTLRPNAYLPPTRGIARGEGRPDRLRQGAGGRRGRHRHGLPDGPGDGIARSRGRDPLFRGKEGIAGILEPKRLPCATTRPRNRATTRRWATSSWRPGKGYAFSLDAAGDDLVVANPNPTAGTHGFLSTEPKMNAIFVVSSAGISKGLKIPTVENIDVAPTMARDSSASP